MIKIKLKVPYLAEAAESLYFMDSEKACNSDELDLWGFSGGDSLKIF